MRANELKKLLQKAYAGDAQSQYWIGSLYGGAWNLTKDREEAVYWFSQAAQQGCKDAQNSLMQLTKNGGAE